ncbi:MAG TPA: hypothetical protein VFN93_09915, partial [Gaiellaceae bacterium]|nr:hypothetical protein [Gaiellaceae bacterium]
PPPRAVERTPRGRLVAAVAVGLVLLALAGAGLVWAVAGNGDGSPERDRRPSVEPVRSSDDPATQARNLADWLRAHSD